MRNKHCVLSRTVGPELVPCISICVYVDIHVSICHETRKETTKQKKGYEEKKESNRTVKQSHWRQKDLKRGDRRMGKRGREDQQRKIIKIT